MNEARIKAIQESFWFIPAIYNAVALIFAIAVVLLDYQLTPDTSLLGIAPLSLSRTTEMLNSLAGGILTMTTITFSAILIVLTTYSAQFSPRVLQDFVSSRATQHVLALFSSGFTFCVAATLIISEEKAYQLLGTPLLAVLWALAGIAAFVFLLNHTASWLRVNNLIGYIADETRATIDHMLKRDVNRMRQYISQNDPAWKKPGVMVTSPISGYVVTIALDSLIAKAVSDDLVVRLEVAVGDFVLEGLPLMTLIGDNASAAEPESYTDLVHVDDEPKSWQDIGFGIRKVAEIGLRALPPANNDPYTAAASIHHMSVLLVRLSHFSADRNAFYSQQDLRLLAREPGFEHYLLGAFQELSRYGSKDNTTQVAILNALGWIARLVDERWHGLLWDFGANTYGLAITSLDLQEAEYLRLRAPLEQLANIVDRHEEYNKLLG
ncbi:DUF2254 domain-containing protein [Marinobacter zhanjiangensis]|uniref:DUF2254 domain-containing protein n=1 Tax=Marinobacter zhanjiangensis TaxID=578215 RepID=A0ABQ3ATG5_9GAMM|nr:DUF2254 domain-containing protein [Marinobacter zhanjiangensis]GGY65759.1 hypothetical protein GCM10007071_10660 [Marinobacter zhanjiangensis]